MKFFKILILMIILSASYTAADEAIGYIRVNISNKPPRVENITLYPEEAYPDSVIECSAVIIDEDAKNTIIYFEWYKNDILLDEKSSNLTDFKPGDEIICKITPNDHAQNGTSAETSVIIQKPRASSIILKNTLNFLGSNTKTEEIIDYQEEGLISVTGFAVANAAQNRGFVSLFGILVILVIININLITRRFAKKSKEI
jgi:hypothetical protein